MFNSNIFSGKTMELDDKLRSEIEAELINYAGPYGEMALSVAFDVALVQSRKTLLQARISESSIEIAIKFVPPVNPLLATARSKGASMAMLDTLCRKEVIKIRRTAEATYLMVKVRRTDKVQMPTPTQNSYIPTTAVA